MNKVYKDNFGNTATIEGVMIFPYKGARKKKKTGLDYPLKQIMIMIFYIMLLYMKQKKKQN